MDTKSEINSNTPSPKNIKLKSVVAKLKRKVLANYKAVRVAIILFVLAVLVFSICLFVNFWRSPNVSYYRTIVKNLILAPKDSVPSSKGRVNILILGKGGETHTAGELTDTIIFASIDLNEKNTFLLSLPRDIWIPEQRAKLNSMYYWGNQKVSNGGLVLAKSEVEKIVGLPVHFSLVFDFSTFRQIIDILGGIEVDVEHGFVDEKFPIAGRENDLCEGDPLYLCRYEKLEFVSGFQKMDGETALKFARSRNAEGDEGTDFAREARQQKVIQGVKNAILNKNFLIDYKKVRALALLVFESVETDIKIPQGATIARKIYNTKNQRSFVLPEEFLINPPISRIYDFQYVFIPKEKSTDGGNNWSSLQSWIKENLNEEN